MHVVLCCFSFTSFPSTFYFLNGVVTVRPITFLPNYIFPNSCFAQTTPRRNWIFTTSTNFLISISLQPDVEHLGHFNCWPLCLNSNFLISISVQPEIFPKKELCVRQWVNKKGNEIPNHLYLRIMLKKIIQCINII